VVRLLVKLALVCMLSIAIFILPASAIYDDFQNHPSNSLSNAEENYNVKWCEIDAGSSREASIQISDINRKYAQLWVRTPVQSTVQCCIKQINPLSQSNHLTAYVKLWGDNIALNDSSSYCENGMCSFTGDCFRILFFNESTFCDNVGKPRYIVGVTDELENYIPLNEWVVVEAVLVGSNIHLYVNGTYKGIVGSCSETPSFVGFLVQEYDAGQDIYAAIDSVLITSSYAIETLPHNWYVLRHWDTPEASGVYNEDDTKVSDYYFTVTYVSSFSGVNAPDEIRVKHFTSGEIVNITMVSSRYGTIYYNFTKMLFHQNKEDDKYGLYLVELMRDGSVVAHDYFSFRWDALNKPAGTISWDRDSYPIGCTAKIHTVLTDPDFTTYVYKGYVYDVYGNKKEEWTITSADEWHEVDLTDYDTGVYYAILKIRNKNTGFEWEEAWDVASVSDEVDIEGVSYDAKSETVLGGVYVNAIQNTVSHETITNETTGEYNISKLSVDMEIQMNASKTNYTHNNFSFTPLKGGLYEINLFLLPDASHINVTAPAIVGLTQLYPFHQNVSYATVNIWNETWSASTTTNSMGYFAFENLTPGTYYLNATHIKCKPSETYEVNLSSGEIEYVYILMHGLYNLTVKARDASTHATIFNFKATLNDGEQTKETTSGWLNFTGVEYGIHKVEVGADGYYSAIEYVYVYGDVEKIFYLMPLETTTAVEQGVGISYPPHQVEFVCVDLFGNPLTNIYVEVTPISTTTGAWDWLLKLFGIRNESITYFTNQTLNGATDSRGAITFVMMENVEYEVRFVNESLGINKTIRIYPKADHYTVVLTPVTSSVVSSEDYITFNLSYEIVGDEINLSLVYSDALTQTQNLTFFVYNSTSLLYQQNFTNVSNVSVSYTVPYKAGEEYMWGYSAFHSRFGEMGRSRILRIAWFLDLGISRTYCTWIAIAIILFLTAMFSFSTVKFGYVAIPIVSLIFAFIGWLPNISIIIIALCLGILAYMSKREKEVGV